MSVEAGAEADGGGHVATSHTRSCSGSADEAPQRAHVGDKNDAADDAESSAGDGNRAAAALAASLLACLRTGCGEGNCPKRRLRHL